MGIKSALFWFSIVLFLSVTWKLLDLPSEAEMTNTVALWLREYGLFVVFIGSLLETLLFIGLYFPGSVIIFLSVALAPSPFAAFVTVLVVSLGMFCAHITNYALGKYGWYRVFLKLGMKNGIKNAELKMAKNDVRYIFYTYWNPGLASFTSTAAGILRMPYLRFLFLMISAIFIWNAFWGVLVFSLGESALTLLSFTTVLKVLSLWICFEIMLLLWKKYAHAI